MTETAYVLDEIAFDPSFDALTKRLRIKEGSRHIPEFTEIFEAARTIARPKAMYKLAFIDEKTDDSVTIDARGSHGGVVLSSRVLRVNLEAAHRLFAYVATCGSELHEWGDSLDDMLHQYWVDAIKEMALVAAIQALIQHLSSCCRSRAYGDDGARLIGGLAHSRAATAVQDPGRSTGRNRRDADR